MTDGVSARWPRRAIAPAPPQARGGGGGPADGWPAARPPRTAEREAAQCRAKLDNPSFTEKAPEAVVGKIRERLAAAEADLARIVAALEALLDR